MFKRYEDFEVLAKFRATHDQPPYNKIITRIAEDGEAAFTEAEQMFVEGCDEELSELADHKDPGYDSVRFEDLQIDPSCPGSILLWYGKIMSKTYFVQSVRTECVERINQLEAIIHQAETDMHDCEFCFR